jgi:hypothetical protein
VVIKYGAWVECDECGDGAGDAGTAVAAPFEAKGVAPHHRLAAQREALHHATENGFVRDADGRLLCRYCAQPETDDEYDGQHDVYDDDHDPWP